MGCSPDACLEDTPFEMLVQCITCRGYSFHIPSFVTENFHSNKVNVGVISDRFVRVHFANKAIHHFPQLRAGSIGPLLDAGRWKLISRGSWPSPGFSTEGN